MIAVIDYGMGNLRSVSKGIGKAGGEVVVSSDPAEIESADAVVLPGVGAFGKCMENLGKCGLTEVVRSVALSGKPFLGICLGLQLLFDESEEYGPIKGLGLIPGRVARFPDSKELTVPHMGWNTIKKRGAPKLLEGIGDTEWFYFVHSYYVIPDNPDDVATWTEYGVNFASSIERGNLFACQFHPEKSSTAGLRLLENFVRLAKEEKR